MNDESKKTTKKATTSNNYRPITCLPMMWKILTAQISGEIYYSLISCGLLFEEQKGYHMGTRGAGHVIHIDQHFLKDSKTKRKNLHLAWIGYKKAYDMVPQIWIIDFLKMCKISDKTIKFIEETMKNW